MVRKRKFTWRKMLIFFQKEIGCGTRFDLLPLEVLKIIFNYKVVGDQKCRKKQRKEKRTQRKKEKREKQEKLMEEHRKRRDAEIARRDAEQYAYDTQRIYDRFGCISLMYNELQRTRALDQLGMENCQRQREEAIQFRRETLQRIERRYSGAGSEVYGPFNLYTKIQGIYARKL
jgi:hypothetical protein